MQKVGCLLRTTGLPSPSVAVTNFPYSQNENIEFLLVQPQARAAGRLGPTDRRRQTTGAAGAKIKPAAPGGGATGVVSAGEGSGGTGVLKLYSAAMRKGRVRSRLSKPSDAATA